MKAYCWTCTQCEAGIETQLDAPKGVETGVCPSCKMVHKLHPTGKGINIFERAKAVLVDPQPPPVAKKTIRVSAKGMPGTKQRNFKGYAEFSCPICQGMHQINGILIKEGNSHAFTCPSRGKRTEKLSIVIDTVLDSFTYGFNEWSVT